MKMAKKQDLTVQSNFMTLANVNIKEMMETELNGLNVSLDKIKVPSAGATAFELEDEDGNVASVKELKVVILYHHHLQTYYKTAFTGKNQPPDCASYDGVISEGDPGGNCNKCPLNQFGSTDSGTNAKACKARRRIYVLREGELFPMLLSLPTGSLKEFTKYIKRLLSKGRYTKTVVTKITLQKAVNTNGLAYSQANFALERVLTDDEKELISPLSEQMKAYSRNVGFEDDISADVPVNVDLETGEILEPLEGSTNV